MDRLAAAGQGVIVAENLAALLKLKVGDPFELAAPNGMLRLPVVGVIRDLSNQLGTVFIDRQVYIRAFGDDSRRHLSHLRQARRRAARTCAARIVERLGQAAAHVRAC